MKQQSIKRRDIGQTRRQDLTDTSGSPSGSTQAPSSPSKTLLGPSPLQTKQDGRRAYMAVSDSKALKCQQITAGSWGQSNLSTPWPPQTPASKPPNWRPGSGFPNPWPTQPLYPPQTPKTPLCPDPKAFNPARRSFRSPLDIVRELGIEISDEQLHQILEVQEYLNMIDEILAYLPNQIEVIIKTCLIEVI